MFSIFFLTFSLIFITTSTRSYKAYTHKEVTPTLIIKRCMSLNMNAKDGKISKPSSGNLHFRMELFPSIIMHVVKKLRFLSH